MSLKTKLGNINLQSCIFNASGVYCKTRENLITLNYCEHVGAILSKSSTVESRNGNELPIYWDDGETKSINSSGLPNMGYKFYMDDNLTKEFNKPYFISVSGMTEKDNVKIIEDIVKSINHGNVISGIELNLSCPNIEGKSQIGYDFEAMNSLLFKVDKIITTIDFKKRREFNFGLKLPPYFDIAHFTIVADIINKYSIDTITCINSLGNGLIVNSDTETVVIKPKGGLGGIGGSIIKPIALSNVRQFSKLTNCDIIGCGGITSGRDIFEHILCGAKAVQIGTVFYMKGINIFKKLEVELLEVMKEKKYESIHNFLGKLREL
jgi:dihydroorotate dehydrogenase (fumarate)